MQNAIGRREFLELSIAGSALCFGGSYASASSTGQESSKLVSPGCRGTKVKVARIYMGNPKGLWPKPELNFKEEIRFYESEFAKLKDELSDVEFVVDELVTSPEQVDKLAGRLKKVDGILVIHLTLEIGPILDRILNIGRPTTVFAVPYSGHEWTGFGAKQRQHKVTFMLTSDYKQLAVAVRPFRAIHHLREAKILNLTTRPFWRPDYGKAVSNKFGTEIKQIELKRVIAAYNAVNDGMAKAEAERWTKSATEVVEPSGEDIFKSCKLALALEYLLDEENATVMTADCYGSMFEPLCQAYAYPCIGFARLNDMGLGGICEADLQSAMTHILYQGLVGKPGFISDPTVDESNDTIILPHCMATPKMDGPGRPAHPYKLRSVMERRAGATPHVKMRVGQKVTQAKLAGPDLLLYFTGEIVANIDGDRACRNKIAVNVDGNLEKLWQNWSHGLHRVTCYGDLTEELKDFCRFTGVKLVNEAA